MDVVALPREDALYPSVSQTPKTHIARSGRDEKTHLIYPIFPAASFDEHLPNFTQLPEMEVYARKESGRVAFRAPSRAALEYSPFKGPLGKTSYCHDRHL